MTNISTPSRNDKCPCGSGKKYKHCCLGNREPATTEPGRLAHVRLEAETRVFGDMLDWTIRRFGKSWWTVATEEILPDVSTAQPLLEFLVPWIGYHHPLDGMPPAAHFLAERGPRLAPSARVILEANLGAWLSFWEVRRVDPGVGLELFDLLTHEARYVHEVLPSKSVPRWAVVLAFVPGYEGINTFGGLHPHPLRPGGVDASVEGIRRILRIREGAVPAERLRAPQVQIALLEAWTIALESQREAASRPPVMQNTDGDPIAICTDHFEFSEVRRDDIFDRLRAIEGADRDESDAGASVVVFSRAGNAVHASWDNTVIGRAVLDGNRLRVESNSVARADALKRRIKAATGRLLRLRVRDISDGASMFKQAQAQAPRPVPPSDPRLQAVLREALNRHYGSWVDSPIPALDGATPREAAARPMLRPRLVALLKDLEYLEGAKPEAERFDAGQLWRELGIDPASEAE